MGYISNVKKVEGYIDDWEIRALKAIGKFIDGEAVERCAKDLGDLVANMDWYVNKAEKFVRNGNKSEHAIYIEKGTGPAAGHGKYMPPKGVLLDWMARQGIPAEAEYAIRWKIYQQGTNPQPFLTPAAEENLGKIEALVKQVKFANGAD